VGLAFQTAGTRKQKRESRLSGLAFLTNRTEKLYGSPRASNMATETTYTALREKLASYLDGVVDDREVLIVRRRGARDVAIVPADELSSLMETAYLLRSPKNAERLLQALAQSVAIDRDAVPAQPATAALKELRRSVGLEPLSGTRGKA
jgi:antitoxin YefM